ncbi:MAG: DUF3303 domain-containing protein [Chloroflexia bacterium]
MKFVALWSLKEGTDQAKLGEVLRRRARWVFPEGLTLIAEYWSAQTRPAVVSIVEAEDAAALVANSVAWLDAMEVQIFPIVTWEEGLQTLSRGPAAG